MINKKKLEVLLSCAASDYSFEYKDRDFTCVVRVTCEDGWVKATVLENEEGGENGEKKG